MISDVDAIIVSLEGRGLMDVVDTVATDYYVTVDDMLGVSKSQTAAASRFELWRRIRNLCGFSYQEIGRLFERHHSTIIVGIRTAEKKGDP